ncbi:MAG: RNA polymerase factor sigma-54 [Parachlamydia sp.]|nr:RNA polymerase factor sigma-54 [Parachlamydia sp.]
MSRSVSLELQQKLAPGLKQMQRLMMTQHMQQALGYLQLPVMELAAAVEQELELNPVLELAEDHEDPEISPLEQEHLDVGLEDEEPPCEKALAFDERDLKILQQLDEDFRDHFNESAPSYRSQTAEEEKWRTYQESLIQAPTSLFEHLMNQARETFADQEDRAMAEALIGNFNARGFLQTPLDEIALLGHFKVSNLERVLKEIQTFEPVGVGAKDLRESLLIQLRGLKKTDTFAYAIIEQHYDDLLHNRVPLLCRSLQCSSEALKNALETIARLDLHPGTACSTDAVQAIRPDVILRQEGEDLVVEVEGDFLPSIRFSRRYLKMLEDDQVPEETKEFIRRKLLSAKWLLRSIHQRNDTLERIASSLARRQGEFFLNPEGKLLPLTMKVIAEELEVHESTIARTVANKYMDTPRGLFPLRAFFTTALAKDVGEDVSSHSVREMMAELIKGEDKRRPLSDEAIALRIQAKGIRCARRTVAKYRLLLKIGNAHQRKQY